MSKTENETAQNVMKPCPTVWAGIGVLAMVLLFELLSGSLLSGLWVSPTDDPSTGGLRPVAWLASVGGLLLIAAPAAFLMYMTHRRRLWALVLLVGVITLEVLGYLSSVTQHGIGNSAAAYLEVAANGGNLVGIALLVSPRSLSWFNRAPPTPRTSGSGAVRPWPVTVAIILYGSATAFDLLIELLSGFSHQHRDPAYILSRALILLVAIPFLTLKLVALYNTYQRRNWARLLFAVIALTSSYLSAIDIESMIPLLHGAKAQWTLMALARGVTPALLTAASLILLFVPSSNQWFRAPGAVGKN